MQTTQQSNLPTKIISCPRSGLPLASVSAICSHGWPLLSAFQANLLHPIYGFPIEKLILKLDADLRSAEQVAWCVDAGMETEIRLTMSAMLYALETIWQPPVEATHLWKQLEPSLPSWAVAIGTGHRLLKLASWYHYATSKRLSFPLYRISTANSNLHWQNFGAWLDEAFEIKAEWESGKNKFAHEAELAKRTAALQEVRAEHIYKRIDFNKVWNWVDVQMSQFPAYPAGRRETFKTIFMKADQAPEEWTLDDIEDVHFAIVETCDMGNEISFFINNRLRQIRLVIEDFYSSFTLLSSVSADGMSALDEVTPQEQAATTAFFTSFDKRATELETLPEAPKRESFASYPKFLQAQAQWNILKRRYDLAKPAVSVAPAASKQQH
jgi:hypothetical protein